METVPSVGVLLMCGFRYMDENAFVDAGIKWGRKNLNMKTLIEFDLRYERRKTGSNLEFCARLPGRNDGSGVILEKILRFL